MTANSQMTPEYPSEWLPRFKAICNDFAVAWEENLAPEISEFVKRIDLPEAERPLQGVLIALEVRLKAASGEPLVLSEYLERFPELKDEVRSAFRTANRGNTVSADSASDSSKKLTFDDLPDRVGRYEILQPLGQGGFGLVCLARDTTLDREVALKFAQHNSFDSREHLSAFIREARIVANLVHRSIVTVYDIQRFDDMLCIVQQYIAGKDLRQELQEGTPTFQRTAQVCCAIADGIGFAHQHGFFHRDIKPANILIDEQGNPLIADFGLAIHESAQRRRKGERTGTPRYMPPELVLGETHRIDGRSDIWSLGVMMYEMLAGARAFRGDSLDEVFDEIQHRNPIPPRQIRPQVPAELERICLKCLSKRVTDRYSSAGDLVDDLKRWLSTENGPILLDDAATTQDFVDSSSTPVVARSVASPPVAAAAGKVIIVPRGLRSFDSHDADFFLHLLPGPHDRVGLPETIRFWRNTIEHHASEAFNGVGLIYGPSGCGKSSFVKAGLIPVLSEQVIPVYVEATSGETESRLLAAIERAVPEIDEKMDLVSTLDSLRDGNWLRHGQKLLIVIDQFEQWLHSHNPSDLSELARAIRQCDGHRISCLLMVRDDFWLATSRFMRTIEVELLEGKNATLIDLFDKPHARRVLTKYGQAYQALPDDLNQLTDAQTSFISAVVDGIAEQDKVICVRLATFAEMFKDKPWSPIELARVGGPQGVGRKFLEDTFESRLATPEHRLHKAAARKFLEALLPEIGSGIRGNMRPATELQSLVGYESRPQEFSDLTRILDQELRLVTLTDPLGLIDDDLPQNATRDSAHYQLAHDFLVQPLREWLTKVRQSTMQGRAQLQLAKRCATWSQNPTKEYLPGVVESANILALTPSKQWSAEESKMMNQASWMHGTRIGLLLVALVIGGWLFINYLSNQQARDLVARLLEAETLDVPPILDRIRESPRAKQLVLEKENDKSLVGDPQKQLHLSMAKYASGKSRAEPLAEIMMNASSSEVQTIVKILDADKEKFIERYWERLTKSEENRDRRIRTIVALASWAPKDRRWNSESKKVVKTLLSDQLRASEWMGQLSPVKSSVVPALLELASEGAEDLDFLLNLARICYEPNEIQAAIDELLETYDPKQSSFLDDWQYATGDKSLAGKKLSDSQLGNREHSLNDYVDRCRRTSNLIAIQLSNGDNRPQSWRHLSCNNLTIRSLLIEKLMQAGFQEDKLWKELEQQTNSEIKSALLLALGASFQETPQNSTQRRVQEIFRNNPDSQVHSAAEWLLKKIDETLTDDALYRDVQANVGSNWQRNSAGISLVKVKGMQRQTLSDCRNVDSHGIPATVDIPNDFFISSKEITFEQFIKFSNEHRDQIGFLDKFDEQFKKTVDNQAKRLNEIPSGGSRTPESFARDQPAVSLTWGQMAAFCNWLSEEDGIPEDQWCYEVDPDFDVSQPPHLSMRLKADWESKKGYRLPTQFEWQLACGAETLTSWCCGSDKDVLDSYAWFDVNTLGDRTSARRVGQLKPNRYGIFDMHGNVNEMTITKTQKALLDENKPSSSYNLKFGGMFFAPDWELTCSKQQSEPLFQMSHHVGFRVVRLAD